MGNLFLGKCDFIFDVFYVCFFFIQIYSVYIATWNVSSKYPDAVHLNKLLGLENNPENDLHRPDIYVIG